MFEERMICIHNNSEGKEGMCAQCSAPPGVPQPEKYKPSDRAMAAAAFLRGLPGGSANGEGIGNVMRNIDAFGDVLDDVKDGETIEFMGIKR